MGKHRALPGRPAPVGHAVANSTTLFMWPPPGGRAVGCPRCATSRDPLQPQPAVSGLLERFQIAPPSARSPFLLVIGIRGFPEFTNQERDNQERGRVEKIQWTVRPRGRKAWGRS